MERVDVRRDLAALLCHADPAREALDDELLRASSNSGSCSCRRRAEAAPCTRTLPAIRSACAFTANDLQSGSNCYCASIRNPGLDQSVDVLLAVSRALVGISARSLADVDDVTLPQFRALVVLAGSKDVTVSTLAERLDIHPSTATRLCDRLVRKGLIRRGEHHRDRREIEVVLSSEGRQLIDHVTRRRRRELARIAQRMPEAKLRHAVTGLRAFAEAAGETPEATLFGWPEAP